MGQLPDEVRAAIVLEVNSQLNPLKETVDRLDKTVRSLYRNGSGGPPGYLETARAEDNEWKEKLLAVVEKHSEQLDQTEDFVTTYNALQEFLHTQTERRQKFIKFWAPKIWKVGASLAVSGMIGCGTLLHKAMPVMQILWEDYLRAHPAAATQLKNVTTNQQGKYYAEKQQQQQDAGNPDLR